LDGLGGVVALHFDLVLSVLMCEMVSSVSVSQRLGSDILDT
jgi:hypothetical protein